MTSPRPCSSGHPYLSARVGFELLRWMRPGIGFEMQADGIARLRDEIGA